MEVRNVEEGRVGRVGFEGVTEKLARGHRLVEAGEKVRELGEADGFVGEAVWRNSHAGNSARTAVRVAVSRSRNRTTFRNRRERRSALERGGEPVGFGEREARADDGIFFRTLAIFAVGRGDEGAVGEEFEAGVAIVAALVTVE